MKKTLLFVALLGGVVYAQNAAKLPELNDYYRKWLNQDVLYIITPEEQDVFLKLTTDEERDQYIEQFWLRRDPDPSTRGNEYKEEHYRRVHYANERYHAGIPGWKTDRGRVYIVFGPPDRLESYPAGGSYDRKAHEGGGWTSVFPFERWEYRYLEGVGADIELEFVNDAGGNLYRLTMDPQDKDEFLRVPGMGLTDAELYNPDFEGKKSFDRVNRIRREGMAHNQGIFLERAKDDPFQKAELLMRISKPPAIRFNDLRTIVTTTVHYQQLPFQVASHFTRADAQRMLVPVTVLFDRKNISFEKEGDRWVSRIQVYGLVTTVTRRTAFEFDDEIAAEYSDQQLRWAREHPGIYQRKMILDPGSYKVELVVKDAISGKTGTQAVSLQVPAPAEDQLSTSSLILSRSIQPAEGDISESFVIGPYRIRPAVDGVFSTGADLAFLLEVYGFGLDVTSQLPFLMIKYAIAPRGKEPTGYKPITHGVSLAGSRVYITRVLQLHGWQPGRYELICSITDTIGNQSVTARAPFEIQ